jgi:uncharacterized protein (UPF0210 family)
MTAHGTTTQRKISATRRVDPDIVRKMLENLPGQTDPVLMSHFGISYNTFRKIRAGEAIRRSVADRLEKRLGPMQDEERIGFS